jgi:uncharacterized protein (DUF2147 family)
MSHSKFLPLIAAASFAIVALAAPAHSAAKPCGKWKRPNGSIAKVWQCDGGMCGAVIDGKMKGFVMFKGIKKSGDVWKGDMKHPGMPGFMTFNGTVKMIGNDKLKVQGCAIGNSMCDAETWVRVK